MTQAALIFVFRCGNDYIGFSTHSDGANLPLLAQCHEPWTSIRAVVGREADLAMYVKSVDIALSNLAARGYHVTRLSQDGVSTRSHDHDR
jgi:hypothetical protein